MENLKNLNWILFSLFIKTTKKMNLFCKKKRNFLCTYFTI